VDAQRLTRGFIRASPGTWPLVSTSSDELSTARGAPGERRIRHLIRHAQISQETEGPDFSRRITWWWWYPRPQRGFITFGQFVQFGAVGRMRAGVLRSQSVAVVRHGLMERRLNCRRNTYGDKMVGKCPMRRSRLLTKHQSRKWLSNFGGERI